MNNDNDSDEGGISKIRKHLFSGSSFEKSDCAEHVRVYLRIKPDSDERHNCGYEVISDRSLAVKSKRYLFTHIFAGSDGRNSQERLFDRVVRDDLAKLIDDGPYNCTLATYGASGSGKTHSLMGTDSEPGVVPRTLEALFNAISVDRQPRFKPADGEGHVALNSVQRENEIREIQKIVKTCTPGGFVPGIPPESNVDLSAYHRMSVALEGQSANWKNFRKVHKKYDVWVSFIEIYNETLSDLLVAKDSSAMHRPSPSLRLVLLNDNKTYVQGAKWVCVRNGTEAYAVLEKGRRHLRYARTNMNLKSSRSHCLFSMRILQYDSDLTNVTMSTFRLCDLAGSERAKRTGNEGVRLDESRSINSSLHVLERCLILLHKQQQGYVTKPPYRDSKLTSLLRNALCGNEAISMLVTINPDPLAFAETQHTLHFSAIAQEIIFEPPNHSLNKSRSCNDLTSDQFNDTSIDAFDELQSLRDEIRRLKFEWDIMMEKREGKIRKELYDKFQSFKAAREKYHEEAISYEQERYRDLQKWQEEMFEQYKNEIEELESENASLKESLNGLQKTVDCFNKQEEMFEQYKNKIEELKIENAFLKESLHSSQKPIDYSNKRDNSSKNIYLVSNSKSDDNYKSIMESIDKLTLNESNESFSPYSKDDYSIFSKENLSDTVQSEIFDSVETTNVNENNITHSKLELNVSYEPKKENNCAVSLEKTAEYCVQNIKLVTPNVELNISTCEHTSDNVNDTFQSEIFGVSENKTANENDIKCNEIKLNINNESQKENKCIVLLERLPENYEQNIKLAANYELNISTSKCKSNVINDTIQSEIFDVNTNENDVKCCKIELEVNSKQQKDNNSIVLSEKLPELYVKNIKLAANMELNNSTCEHKLDDVNDTVQSENCNYMNALNAPMLTPKPKVVFSTPKKEINESIKENIPNKFYTEKKEKQNDDLSVAQGCLTVGASRRKLFARRQNNEMAAEIREPPKSLKHLNFDEESPGVIKPPKVEKPYQYETRSRQKKKK